MKAQRILLLPVLLLGPACDVSPQAPEGTVFTVSANPSEIAAGETAVVSVLARHPSGGPVKSGTRFFFSSTLGSIDPKAETDGEGMARATLRTNALSAGVATVTVSSGLALAEFLDFVEITVGDIAALP